MTQQTTDDWKARQENLLGVPESIDEEATVNQILILFGMLPNHRQKALLAQLDPEPSFHGDFFE